MANTRIVSNHPALILNGSKRYLVISDLHIGFEGSFKSNDIFIEPLTSVQELLGEIREIINSEKPDTLILLGDIKTGIGLISDVEWKSLPEFFEISKEIETVLVPGNHDANIEKLVPEFVKVSSSSGIVIDDILLTHGHTLPSENISHVNKIIMGHLHPVFLKEGSVLNGQRVWVSIKTDKRSLFPSLQGEIEIVIMPTFNRFFYTTKKQIRKSISPIVQKITKIHLAKVVTLDGSIIGDEAVLKHVI